MVQNANQERDADGHRQTVTPKATSQHSKQEDLFEGSVHHCKEDGGSKGDPSEGELGGHGLLGARKWGGGNDACYPCRDEYAQTQECAAKTGPGIERADVEVAGM